MKKKIFNILGVTIFYFIVIALLFLVNERFDYLNKVNSNSINIVNKK